MDISRDVTYRGFKLNDEDLTITAGNGIGSGLSGCILDSADISDVDVVQFTEKRSLQDGMDVGDVYLGARRVRLAGTLYGLTKGLLFDSLQSLRDATSPTLAFRESPAEKGYLPLYYSVPTNRVAEYPTGAIALRVLALPRSFQAIIQRDNIGSDDEDSLAIPWQATFVCKDPRIMAAAPQEYTFTPGAAYTATGDFVNRGSYHAPLNMLVSVGTAAGSIVVNGGGSVFTITVPSSTLSRIIRYNGEEKILTVTENNVEALRMDLLTFQQSTTHPLIPHGTSGYTVTFTGVTINSGSRMWFWESYA